jgi:hypothetical protein
MGATKSGLIFFRSIQFRVVGRLSLLHLHHELPHELPYNDLMASYTSSDWNVPLCHQVVSSRRADSMMVQGVSKAACKVGQSANPCQRGSAVPPPDLRYVSVCLTLPIIPLSITHSLHVLSAVLALTHFPAKRASNFR